MSRMNDAGMEDEDMEVKNLEYKKGLTYLLTHRNWIWERKETAGLRVRAAA